MCGIVGYTGPQKAVPILIDGLKKLEYRGYDSAGLAVIEKEGLIVDKAAGKISRLEAKIEDRSFGATCGIAHTRWATHGEPTTVNAHPHFDSKEKIAIVHNGIIENYRSLREYLEKNGHQFSTETDTEILAHLIEQYYEGDLLEAVRTALVFVEGTYGIAVISANHPGEIVVARSGSPLVIGCGHGENFVASDVSALVRHTRQVVYLEEGEIAHITPDDFKISTIDKVAISPNIQQIEWSLDAIEKGGFDHFMLKEIFEQPTAVANAFRGRLNYEEGISRLHGLKLQYEELLKINRVLLMACGTSWHAGMIGEYIIEDLARIPTEVEYASEFRYRAPIIQNGTVAFVISQSGETADTLAALREAKRKGATVLGICNVVGSSIARETDGGIYIHAG
nr:glutamine--fructose-6-phosphate transaminase (isomerizing) [candidate division Zixibacteria bacterium]NIR65445.1 glutamine--fructose-6-phosphate transaminase (isomerizing) [candidate division Zixibacteria bacterium]NIS15314.1 glutamine--fructose-6-phosphate transaminase (isomerizing) [candidate division Zixibacteria bacterium]NIS47136.1 glutamine--fructose-6-phosphate transaminase (isomerizing) [candidate division Zixibacteria bacterium]NIT51837.1 glutamine--fructose-6-phosphate transaminase